VLDKDGNEVSNRHDDLVKEGTITLKFNATYNATLIEDPENTISYEGVTWRITSVDKNQVNNDHREITYGIKHTQYVTSFNV
jgi:hypothetical protein